MPGHVSLRFPGVAADDLIAAMSGELDSSAARIVLVDFPIFSMPSCRSWKSACACSVDTGAAAAAAAAVVAGA